METIKIYLDNMFAGLPKTARIQELKSNILSNMEEKYHELKRQGKTENEAIGIVISEFGNIDELVEELGIKRDATKESQPVVTVEEAEEYLAIKKTMGTRIGFGVILCITAPALMILLSLFLRDGIIPNNLPSDVVDIPGTILLLALITVAVAIFIYSGMRLERYNYMEKGVQLPGSLEILLRQRYDSYTPKFYLNIIAGVCLIIFSPSIIFIASIFGESYEEYGTVFMLILIAGSVYLFVTSGMIRDSYERLLKLKDYAKPVGNKEKENKVIGAVAAVIWPLASLIFLFCGFVYNLWHPAWIIFPVTGILFGMFSAAYSIISKDE